MEKEICVECYRCTKDIFRCDNLPHIIKIRNEFPDLYEDYKSSSEFGIICFKCWIDTQGGR